MDQLAELAVRGVLIGCVYGIVAIPISLVYITTDTVDLAVGGYATVAGVVASALGGAFGILAGLGAGVAAASVIATIFLVLARKGGSPDPITIVLSAFGVAIVLESIVLVTAGTDPVIERLFDSFWRPAGISINPQGVVNLAIGLLLVAGLWALLRRTALGRSMRASAINPRGASLAGIPVRRVQFGTFLAGGLLAGLAGVLILYTNGIDYTAGLRIALLGLSAAVVFGLDSPLRGFAGGIAIGVVEALAGGYVSSGFSTILPMLFILLMLASGRLGSQTVAGVRP